MTGQSFKIRTNTRPVVFSMGVPLSAIMMLRMKTDLYPGRKDANIPEVKIFPVAVMGHDDNGSLAG